MEGGGSRNNPRNTAWEATPAPDAFDPLGYSARFDVPAGFFPGHQCGLVSAPLLVALVPAVLWRPRRRRRRA